MEYDASSVRDMIQEYTAGRADRRELGAWAFSAYEDMLKGGYLELRKLAVYPFLKTLSSLRVEVDDIADQYPAAREDVDRVYDILRGVKNTGFSVEIAPSNQFFKIPPEQYDRMNEIYEFALGFDDGGPANCVGSIQNIHDLITKREPNTIYDLIELTVAELFEASFDIQDGVCRKKAPLRLYTPESREFAPLRRLKQCLASVHNNNNFCFFVRFREGTPKISLII